MPRPAVPAPQPTRRSLTSTLTALAAALAVTACGSIPEPQGYKPPETTTVAALANLSTGSTQGGDVASQPSPNLGFVPQAPAGYVPEVLVSTDKAVLTAAVDGFHPMAGPLGAWSTTRVVDDLLGGVVVQQSPEADGRPGKVLWLAAESITPTVIDGNGARLLDVGYVGGSPVALVLRDGGQVDRIRLVDLATTVMIQLKPDETLLSLSASGGLDAVVVANAQCGDLRFYSADGEVQTVPGPGQPDCIVPRRAAYGPAALSPDGRSVAYTLVTYRGDGIEVATEVVVRNLDTGIDYFRRKIAEDGERISGLSFDGQRLVYQRSATTGSSLTILELTGNQRELPLTLPAATVPLSASFARLRLANG